MPELPEVETVVRDLRPLLVGRTIRSIRSGKHKLRKPWKPSWNAKIIDRCVVAIERRGKWILIRLDAEPVIVVHLGMTGQLTVPSASEPLEDHTHLQFALDDDRELRFRDIRRFGSAELFESMEILTAHLQSRLGPEPFGVDPDYFSKCLKSTARTLKAVLLDQSVLAGVGNIYADESCFLAGLRPGRRARSLKGGESDALRLAIEHVLTNAIAGRGSSIRNYVGGSGLRGRYQEEFAVYGRGGEPCRRCDTPIEVARIAGRSSHFCPRCQK